MICVESSVSAADANRKFSELLRHVREGQSFVVTSHGRPVAKLTPISATETAVTAGARQILFARLRDEPVLNIGKWTRAELYERDDQ